MSIVVTRRALCRSCGWPRPGVSYLVLASVDFATFDLGFRLADFLGRGLGGRPASRICSAGAWSATLPRGLARQGPRWSSGLVDLLGRGLVGRFASWTCSTGAWSVAPPYGLARPESRWRSRLVDSLGGDLVGR